MSLLPFLPVEPMNNIEEEIKRKRPQNELSTAYGCCLKSFRRASDIQDDKLKADLLRAMFALSALENLLKEMGIL
jgi:hypothetical protein